ncbi:hypothetical protein [Actinosynnema sp. NPDC020468]|uniref:hypothetical protein n=1 Tax=Actinosynnema sp. NPDC020468 TaxID=3154488 RepID=UPI003409A77D
MALLTKVRPVLVGLVVAAAVPGVAAAGTEHVVVTANSPSTGQPVTGGGTWLVNKPSGYYLGRELPGGRFDNEETSPAGWHYGRAGGPDLCSWAMPGSLGAVTGRPPDSCSATTRERLSHRRGVGRDYNAPAHEATDGTSVAAGTCTLYYNYFHGTDFPSNGGHWANPAGPVGGSVRYRFTTLDGRAAVVRDPALGWGFVPLSCVTRPSPLYNDDD